MARIVVAWALVVAVSIVFYALERSMVHFLWHLGYGASAGLLVAAIVAPRRPLQYALAGYAFMIVPDLLWLAGRWTTGTPIAHAPWMDVFLFHVRLDEYDHATLLVLPVYVTAWAAVAARRRASGLGPKSHVGEG